ncbi:MAG: pGP6-D family virulence protein [Simkaniaceae bacterium]|nr:pGP6-D family virulence protein [Simkaniaceae bacterium]
MVKLKDLLKQRMTQKGNSQKMATLGGRSTAGELSGFSGVFRVAELTESEKEMVDKILTDHNKNNDVQTDFKQLIAITAEVKAINNQAILLHGERIKRAHELLKDYNDGAFSAWLITTYGNRQTPYNFLQYYEFYSAASPELQKKIDMMPKQAIYTLASREGSREQKTQVIENYKGERKEDILETIRTLFPSGEVEAKRSETGSHIVKALTGVLKIVKRKSFAPTDREREAIEQALKEISNHV